MMMMIVLKRRRQNVVVYTGVVDSVVVLALKQTLTINFISNLL